MRNLSPDAARYLAIGQGIDVPRPFHLRRALPALCRNEAGLWWWAYGIGWASTAIGMWWWRLAAGDPLGVALAATALLVGLPGLLGPSGTIPVQVDLPATGLVLCGLALLELGHPAQVAAAVIVFGLAASVRESSPVWAALLGWSFWPLLALVVPLLVAWRVKPGPDPLGPKFQRIADLPIVTAWEHHFGRWRDGWLMVAPWGVTLAALYSPDWRLLVVLVVAHLQLLVATDTVRLLHHAAGPAMASAAASTIPSEWLLLAVVFHLAWFWRMERV